MALTEKDVEHVARLARLGLTNEEKKLYLDQLSRILEYAQNIQKVNTEKVEPTYHSLALTNVLRKDVISQAVDPEKILALGPETISHMYAVPRILE